MKKKTMKAEKAAATSDPVMQAALPALRPAARNARKLAEESGTPFRVMRKGKLVNLNPNAKVKSAATKRRV